MKEKGKHIVLPILPVMSGFVAMAFADVAGLSRNYIQEQFALPDTVSGLIPMACYLWFLVCSIPTALLIDRLGRKNVVLSSLIVSSAGLLTVFFLRDSLWAAFLGTGILGLGNTILMVSLNPLLHAMVPEDRFTGILTIGQGIKSGISILIPLMLPVFATTRWGWQGAFGLFAAICLLGAVMISTLKTEQSDRGCTHMDLRDIFAILHDGKLLLVLLTLVLLVGTDVGVCTSFPPLFKERTGVELNSATSLTFVYPLSKALVSAFGGFLLLKFNDRRYYIISFCLSLAGLLAMTLAKDGVTLIAGLIAFGLGYSNLFPILFSRALGHDPLHSDAISAIVVTSLVGGAVIPPLIGLITSIAGTQTAAIAFVLALWPLSIILPLKSLLK